MNIARQLVEYGLGHTLFAAASRLQFAEFMDFHAKWWKQLRDLLESDPQHHLG